MLLQSEAVPLSLETNDGSQRSHAPLDHQSALDILDSPTARIAFWLIVPLALASTVSVLIASWNGSSPISMLNLRLNNSFGVGAQALLDSVRVWTGGDWIVNDSWTPMLRALEHLDKGTPSSLYETLFFAEKTKFQYPLTSLLPLELIATFFPLNASTLNAVNSLMLLANATIIALLAYTVFGGGNPPSNRPQTRASNVDARAVAVLAFGATWLFYPVTRAFNLGQIQLWIDLAFTSSCLLWLLNRKTAAGVFIGLAAMIKPQLGLLILWALVWREWSLARGFLFATVPIALLSVARYGWDNHISYLNVLSYISQHGESFYRNNSVNGLISRLLLDGSNLEWDANSFAPYNSYVHAATMLASIAFVLLPLLVAFVRRDRAANFFDFGAAALCFTLASPVAWEHHYGIMLPLFVGLLGFALQDGSPEARRTTLPLLTLAWVLSAGLYVAVDLLAATPLNFLQSYLFFAALLLLFLLLRAASGTMNAQPFGPHQPRAAP